MNIFGSLLMIYAAEGDTYIFIKIGYTLIKTSQPETSFCSRLNLPAHHHVLSTPPPVKKKKHVGDIERKKFYQTPSTLLFLYAYISGLAWLEA